MAQLINQLVGHQTQSEWLLEQAKNGTLPSALIFQGPKGVGKSFLATALLQVMNCQKADFACGECSDCHRVLEDKNELIYHLKPEGKKKIGVDQVREVHSFVSLKSLKPARFVIIDPADKLSVQAANSLLKVLEESPEKTHFILLTENMRGLLPTIRSRSHLLKFSALKAVELQQYKEFSNLSLEWADGRLQMALELEEEDRLQQLNDSLKFLYALLSEGPQAWKAKAPWFFDNDQEREFGFNIWKQALSKRLHNQGENLEWIPSEPALISRIYDNLEFLKADLAGNMDKTLAIENFYYRLHSREERV